MTLTEDERRRLHRRYNPHLGDDMVLQPGQSMHVPLMLRDAAPAGAHQKDTAMTVNINDTLQRLPAEFRHKIRHAIGYMGDSDPHVAESGIANASNLRVRMAMARGDFGGGGMGGMVTDAEKSDLTAAIEYLDGFTKVTRQRIGGGR